MRVAALVCPNGLGHFRRVVRILSNLRLLVDELSIDLICEQWQMQRTAGGVETNALLAAGARTHTGILSPGVTWSADPALYRDGRLSSWEDRIVECAPLRDADHVLSDNLGGVLRVRPDAVLSGSFLWSDVLHAAHPSDDAVRAFADRERGLLSVRRPPMLCVDDIAMPAIGMFTERVGLPWMCERVPRRPVNGRPRVAVLGGATGADDELLRTHIAALEATGDYELCLPRALLSSSPDALPFDHSLGEYATLAAVVCRPGVGTMTDCIATGVPLVCVFDSNNPELSHNSARVEALGVGEDVGRGTADDVTRAVANVMASNATIQRNIAMLRTDGAMAAAQWLAEHWGRRP